MAATKTRPWLRNPRRYSTEIGGGAVESRVDLRIPDVTTTAPTTMTPRRRWLQFSLRTLMVLTLTFGCGFGWLGMMLTRLLQHQHQAVELRNHGRLLNRRMATTKAVTLETGPVQLDHLGALTGLQEPDFRRVRVTDAGVAELQKALPNCRIER